MVNVMWGEDEIEDQWRWWAGQRLLQILHMNYEIDDGVGLEVMVVDLHKPAECLTAGSYVLTYDRSPKIV